MSTRGSIATSGRYRGLRGLQDRRGRRFGQGRGVGDANEPGRGGAHAPIIPFRRARVVALP